MKIRFTAKQLSVASQIFLQLGLLISFLQLYVPLRIGPYSYLFVGLCFGLALGLSFSVLIKPEPPVPDTVSSIDAPRRAS